MTSRRQSDAGLLLTKGSSSSVTTAEPLGRRLGRVVATARRPPPALGGAIVLPVAKSGVALMLAKSPAILRGEHRLTACRVAPGPKGLRPRADLRARRRCGPLSTASWGCTVNEVQWTNGDRGDDETVGVGVLGRAQSAGIRNRPVDTARSQHFVRDSA